ncbi:MAG: chromosome segregation protein SMC [Halobacteriota archaeon]|nr:chromosome segregation protein SMC [Halobacteriota archaeon]
MHIKEIEIKDFKSFHKTRIPFFDDFTTISGPNGCGKSNIVDAIIFTLGLSNSRTMRAERLTDLINSSNGNNFDLAEVSLKFDNSDRKITVDEDDVTVTRRIKRTENGYYSYFYFNGRSCNLSDIHRELSKSGISPDGFNVIMQGDVTQIIKMTPVERRKIIEEIAGVAEFDNKTEKAFKELKFVKDRIDMIDIILSEVDSRLEQLKDEKDQALRYNELKNEKKKYESFFLISKLKSAEKELLKIEREVEEKQSRKDASAKDLSGIKVKISEEENKLKDLNDEIAEKGEDEANQIKMEIEEMLGNISRCSGIIDSLQNELAETGLEQKKSFTQIISTYNRSGEILRDIDKEMRVRAGLLGKIGEKKAILDGINEKISEVGAEFTNISTRLSRLKVELEVQKNNKNELLRDNDRLADAQKRRSAEKKHLKEETDRGTKLRLSMIDERGKINEALVKINGKIEALSRDLSDLELRRVKMSAEVAAIKDKLQAAEQEYAKKEVIAKSVKKSRYSHSVGLVLDAMAKGRLKGIHGAVAELCKVDKRYAIALEIAAGNRMQCVVVDDDEDASGAINYLKQMGAGRATFLPLNKMNGRQLNNDIGMEGVIDYAINLVHFDPKFYPAFWYVYRDTVVTENLDTARRLMNKYRLVTLGGELIEKSGAMTGGSAKSRFLPTEEDINRIRDLVTKHEEELSRYTDELKRVEGHIESLKENILELGAESRKKELELGYIDERISRLSEELAHKEKRLSDINAEEGNISGEIGDIESKISKKHSIISELAHEIEELEQSLTNSEARKMNEEAEAVSSDIYELEDDVRTIDVAIKELNLKKEYLDKELEENINRMKELKNKKKQLNTKIDENKDDIKILEGELKVKREVERKFSVELSDLRGLRDEKMSEISELKHRSEEILRNYDGLVDSISILGNMKSQLIADIDELKEEVGEYEEDTNIPSHETIRSKISQIEGHMSRLEPVNMRAIAEYDAVLQRQLTTKSRRDVLGDERKEIIGRIEKYEQLKRQTFMETFDAINDNFKKTFEELSGGYGELLLENYDEPFSGGLLIKARPAGKNLMRLEAMSGGEKSLTALSFLFSIQRHRPAPFYALDEVDMFLDGANVDRVAKMIKKLAGDAQFIVVSLREPMIEAADRTIGVVMQEKNISSVTGIKLNGNGHKAT